MLALSAFVMIAVPFGLRVLTDCLGEAEGEADQSTVEKLAEIFGDGRTPAQRLSELATKPHGDWTPEEAAANPRLFAWLKRHARTVLPWEWSETAKAKDVAGYCRIWSSLFDELEKVRNREQSALAKELKRANEDQAEERALVERVNARLRDARSDLATNGIPATVVSETVRRGLLWGFNRKLKKQTASSLDELKTVIAAEEASLRKSCDGIIAREEFITKADTRQKTLAALAEGFSAARVRLEGWRTNSAASVSGPALELMEPLLDGVLSLSVGDGQ